MIGEIQSQIEQIVIPGTNTNLAELKAVKSVHIGHEHVDVSLELSIPIALVQTEINTQITAILAKHHIQQRLKLSITSKILARTAQVGLAPVANVKNIVAVASGKGGVGKSTVTANLAMALQMLGARVGVLDADIYGPNQPQMLGVSGHPESTDEKKLKPMMAHGLQTMSMGYLVEQVDTPMIWRGPMVASALQQLLQDTLWDDLDYLLLDLPPGTGDIQLTMAQKIPVACAVIVTTPQDIALLDVQKAIKMFEKVRVPMVGIIENMSMHICKNCGAIEPIFGELGAKELSDNYHLPVLGQIPLDIAIRQAADAGKPFVASDPNHTISSIYQNMASKIAIFLALQQKNYVGQFPKIVIE